MTCGPAPVSSIYFEWHFPEQNPVTYMSSKQNPYPKDSPTRKVDLFKRHPGHPTLASHNNRLLHSFIYSLTHEFNEWELAHEKNQSLKQAKKIEQVTLKWREKKEQKRIQRTEKNLRRKFNWIIRDSTREIKNFFFLIQVVFLLKHKYEDRMSWKRE